MHCLNGVTLLGGKLKVGHGYAGSTNRSTIGRRTISWAGGPPLNYIRLMRPHKYSRTSLARSESVRRPSNFELLSTSSSGILSESQTSADLLHGLTHVAPFYSLLSLSCVRKWVPKSLV